MHCFLNEIRVSPAQLNCLGLLGLYGEINMSDFCAEVVSEEIFGNVQTTRNFITKCASKNSGQLFYTIFLGRYTIFMFSSQQMFIK